MMLVWETVFEIAVGVLVGLGVDSDGMAERLGYLSSVSIGGVKVAEGW